MFQSDQPQFLEWLAARDRKPTARLVVITSVADWGKDRTEADIFRQLCLEGVVQQLDMQGPRVDAYSPTHAPMSATLDQLREHNDVDVLLTMCVRRCESALTGSAGCASTPSTISTRPAGTPR